MHSEDRLLKESRQWFTEIDTCFEDTGVKEARTIVPSVLWRNDPR